MLPVDIDKREKSFRVTSHPTSIYYDAYDAAGEETTYYKFKSGSLRMLSLHFI
jgi:hypothetical protein